ncbi:MAG: M23 family metallopeptidase [Hyphomicrobiales bacterium]|nr:M23 family metallopeptidase [Hyphomicrobiales bacterium]MBV8823743.1 M23 family metallopeptidase [Hyphomicrobiales bacterium]
MRLTALSAVTAAFVSQTAFAQGFMTSPLNCSGPIQNNVCTRPSAQWVYTPGIMTTVLDHSLVRNGNGKYQYGTVNDGGGDGKIVAFNGETAHGKPGADVRCIAGTILLRPAPNLPPMTNTAGCGPNYASYDEHPGYDYVAGYGSPVLAAAAGTVVDIRNYPGGPFEYCYNSNFVGYCVNWGWVGIDHGNGYISQYGHLSSIHVLPGQKGIKQGQVIGFSGNTAPPSAGHIGPHLHFEVLKVVNGQYLVVDPYGWVGAPGADPLYSKALAPPVKLWK